MKKILFVCTGNTCRSPMAETILARKLQERGIDGVTVDSAGLMCAEGQPMSENARAALALLGYKPRSHKSAQFTPGMLKEYDLIITMTARHALAIGNYDNVKSLDELAGKGEIGDPYGGSLEDYLTCAKQIETSVSELMGKLKFD